MVRAETKSKPGGRQARLTAAAILVVLSSMGVYLVRAQSNKPIASNSAASRTEKPGATTQPAILVTPITVRSSSVQETNALSGQIEPYRVATVSAELARRIIARPIEQGRRVAAGQVLALLDSESAQAALAQAQAAFAQATATRRQAEADYSRALVETDSARQTAHAGLTQAESGAQKARTFTRRQEKRQAEAALAQAQIDERLAKIENDRYAWLVRQGASPQQMLDRVQATYEAAVARRQSAQEGLSLANEGARQEDIDAAQAQVETAQANVRTADTRPAHLASIRSQIDGLKAQEAQALEAVHQARITLDKCRITAPFPARVLATLAENGEMTASGSPVARLGDIQRVKATFAVPEASRPALNLGQTLRLTADALPGRTWTGTVMTLGFQADARSRAFPLELVIANLDEKLLPNMIARLRLPVGKSEKQILIPASALAGDDGSLYVFALRDGKALRRAVTTGAPVGSQEIEILDGLKPGETIAATPQRLTDGAAIKMAREETKEGNSEREGSGESARAGSRGGTR